MRASWHTGAEMSEHVQSAMSDTRARMLGNVWKHTSAEVSKLISPVPPAASSGDCILGVSSSAPVCCGSGCCCASLAASAAACAEGQITY